VNPPDRHSDRGSVTAETAVVLPALAAVLALSLWAVAAVTTQLQCVDAARVAARAVARGETAEMSRAVAARAAPEGASISIRRSGDLVEVEVRSVAKLPGTWGHGVPPLHVGARATAALEDSGDAGAAP
jgi:hypothetical protein